MPRKLITMISLTFTHEPSVSWNACCLADPQDVKVQRHMKGMSVEVHQIKINKSSGHYKRAVAWSARGGKLDWAENGGYNEYSRHMYGEARFPPFVSIPQNAELLMNESDEE